MQKEKKDPFREIEDRQYEMAKNIAARLVKLLDAALWFPLAVSDEVKIDPDSVRLFVTKELEMQVQRSIKGYTDWVAYSIIHSKRFGERPFPVPCGKDADLIVREYSAQPQILDYVVERLAKQDSLPLLGLVRRGMLIPDKKALKEWAKFFDWREKRETGPA